jgi:hypothetical protein
MKSRLVKGRNWFSVSVEFLRQGLTAVGQFMAQELEGSYLSATSLGVFRKSRRLKRSTSLVAQALPEAETPKVSQL